MDHQKIIQQIKHRVFHPAYLLCGEEPYYIDLIAEAIEKEVLQDSEKEFNQTILYGADTDIRELAGLVKRYPMMASHLVVIVREAQAIRDFEPLQSWLEAPSKSTILVLCYKYKKPDKRKSFYKAISKHGVVFESDKLKEWQLPNWIVGYVKEQGYTISEKGCMMLAEHLGNDLSKITNELGKVFVSLQRGSQVTPEIIERDIGISKDYNIFEFQKAIGTRDLLRANQIMLHFGNNLKENPLPVIMAILYTYFAKILKLHFAGTTDRAKQASLIGVSANFLQEYQLAAKNYPAQKVIRVFGYLRQYDLRSKGVNNENTDHAELLKELLFKILH
jgi:DNA polymerase III subunit delta